MKIAQKLRKIIYYVQDKKKLPKTVLKGRYFEILRPVFNNIRQITKPHDKFD